MKKCPRGEVKKSSTLTFIRQGQRPFWRADFKGKRSSNTMASSSEDAVSQLTAMGFEEAQVQEALNVTNGNMEQAVNFLLGDGGISDAATESLSQSSSLVLCYTSQYSVENGRSACTCIGLMGAALFLQSQEKKITRDLLQRMVVQGVAAYQRLPTSSNNVEHLSAEEVLQSDSIEEFKSLSLVTSARQGVLSGNSSHPLGLKALPPLHVATGAGLTPIAIVPLGITNVTTCAVVSLPIVSSCGVGFGFSVCLAAIRSPGHRRAFCQFLGAQSRRKP